MNFKKFMLKKVRVIVLTTYLIKVEDFDLDHILIDENSHENILIYKIPYKTLTDPKPFCIRFSQIDGLIKIYDGTRYLTFFRSEEK